MRRVIDDERLANIASAIRKNTGKTTTYTDEEMAGGVAEVYEAGKKAEHNEFWDKIGTEGSYRFSGTAWNKNTFKPTKNFSVGKSCFFYHNWQGSAYDLAAQLEELGVTMTIGSTADQQSFYYAWFTRVPELDFTPCSGSFDRVFYGDSQLVTIDKIILPLEGKVTSFNTPFQDCSKLKNVIFEGVLDKSISFSDSPLTVASMKSIISCLKDYAGTSSEYTYTLTFKSTCWTALDAEGATAPGGITWRDYITAKGWNGS